MRDTRKGLIDIPEDAVCIHCGDFAEAWREEPGYACLTCYKELVLGITPHVSEITATKFGRERRFELDDGGPGFDDVIRALEEDR